MSTIWHYHIICLCYSALQKYTHAEREREREKERERECVCVCVQQCSRAIDDLQGVSRGHVAGCLAPDRPTPSRTAWTSGGMQPIRKARTVEFCGSARADSCVSVIDAPPRQRGIHLSRPGVLRWCALLPRELAAMTRTRGL